MIDIFVNGQKIAYDHWVFPGGEVGVKLPKISDEANVDILVLFPDSVEIMKLFNIFDALKHQAILKSKVNLTIPYFPYARQDRVCVEGESFALEVFCKMLKAFGHFGTLITSDLHSKTSRFLLESKDFVHTDLAQGYLALKLPEFDHLFAPDKGAVDKIKKHSQVTKSYRPAWVHYFDKTRTPTGIIYEAALTSFEGTGCVVDDICDGGETFLKLGQMLKQTQPQLTSLSLYVTHGIFSNDTKFKQLLEIYDTIYVKYLMNDSLKQFVKVI